MGCHSCIYTFCIYKHIHGNTNGKGVYRVCITGII